VQERKHFKFATSSLQNHEITNCSMIVCIPHLLYIPHQPRNTWIDKTLSSRSTSNKSTWYTHIRSILTSRCLNVAFVSAKADRNQVQYECNRPNINEHSSDEKVMTKQSKVNRTRSLSTLMHYTWLNILKTQFTVVTQIWQAVVSPHINLFW
jgi:hypothetical protein